MNDKFDELAKGLARSVTRRGALKKFGLGLAGMALATLGLANKADSAEANRRSVCDCNAPYGGCKSPHGGCYKYCLYFCS